MMRDKNPPIEQSEIVASAVQLIQEESKVYFNLAQAFIVTTEDKVLICLTKHLSRMGKKKAWLTPLGILLTIIVVFPTTNFQTFIFDAETWKAMFIITGVLSFIWLCYAIWQSRVSTSISEVVADIKKTAIITEKPLDDIISTSSESEAVRGEYLVIHSATYGAEDSFTDVTGILKSNIKDGKLEFSVSNHNLGGDPKPNVEKKLDVQYFYKGNFYSTVVKESEVLTLP